jgi:hypothetical protein
MINQLEIPMFLEDALPEMTHLPVAGVKQDAYKAIKHLATFTDQQIRERNFDTVKKCFAVADRLYDNGNGVVKNAIQNVFVFSFTKMFQSCPAHKGMVLGMIPMGLFTLYVGQLYHSGC